MSLSRELWQDARALAERCLAHPFVRGLGDGSLDVERYRGFIAQDAFFLEAFARGYAHCLAAVPDRDGVYAFHRLLDGVFEELALHAKAARELEIDLAAVEPSPATLAYTAFIEQTVEGGSAGETLAAMTPCMRLYAYLGRALADAGTQDSRYAEWVATYADEDFQALAALVEALLDRYAEGSAGEREHYGRAMELEYAFFEAAWRDPARAD